MVLGFIVNVCCWRFTAVSFLWYTLLGATVTFAAGYAASRILFDSSRTPQKLEVGNG
jgi:hypothetical protein